MNLPASWKATVMDDGENPQLTLRPRLGVRSSQDLAAPSFLDAWIERARATGIQQIITMSHTLSLHRQGLLADYVVGTSSSPLERTNDWAERRGRKQVRSPIKMRTRGHASPRRGQRAPWTWEPDVRMSLRADDPDQ